MSRKRKEVLRKEITIGILFLILLLFSLLLSFETPNSIALGDTILKEIGLKTWSADEVGFHYTIIYAFALFLIGYIGVTHFLKDAFPRFIKRLPVILVIFLLLLPTLYSFTNQTIKSFSQGIDSISYHREISTCEYHINSDGNVILNADLEFENFSKKDVTFYIKLVPGESFTENIINESLLIATDSETDEPQEFTIPPKAVINLSAHFKTSLKTDITNLQGTMKPLNIIIYTDAKEKKFIKNNR